MSEDILIELSRTMCELEVKVERRLQERRLREQLGDAFNEDRSEART